ncbi:MAG: glycosyltransferase family 4 protein, partial [Actinomycetota bacterium]
MSEQKTVGVFVPGLEGGVDEAAHHLFGAGDSADYRIHIYETKGLDPKRAPLVFGRMLLTVILHRLTGRLDGAHLNMSFRGSTIRKTIIGLLLVVLRVPYVVQIHSGGYRGWWANLGKRPRVAVRAMTGRARRVAVLGEVFLPVATQDFGIPAERAIVMPNAVPAQPPSANAIPVGDESGGAPTPAAVLYLGRLHTEKGTFDLIDALANLADLDWSATLAGNDQVAEVRAAVASAGLTDRITVLDWIDRDEATRLAGRSTIFALPSRNEAMSMSLLEAMGQGMACIATEVGAHGDFLADGENALVVEPGSV